MAALDKVAIETSNGNYKVLHIRNLYLDNAPRNVSWYEIPLNHEKPIMAYYNGKRVDFTPSVNDKLLLWDLVNVKNCKRNIVDL